MNEIECAFIGKIPSLILVANKYLKNIEESEDCVQEVFLKISNPTVYLSYQAKGSLDAWLKRIVINCAIDRYRRGSSRKIIYNSDFIDSCGFPEESNSVYHRDYSMESILIAIEGLSPVYKKVAELYLIKGHTHNQISKILDIKEGTSKSNLAKAKKNIIKSLTSKNYNI